jgi:ribosome-associated protein
MIEALRISDNLEIPKEDLSYETMRSGGPGGQHANTSDTRVRLRFDLEGCKVLNRAVKNRIRTLHSGRLTSEGELLLTVSTNRSQRRNLELAREKLAEIISDALVAPKKRKPTRPGRGARERRLSSKHHRSKIKKNRGRVDGSKD